MNTTIRHAAPAAPVPALCVFLACTLVTGCEPERGGTTGGVGRTTIDTVDGTVHIHHGGGAPEGGAAPEWSIAPVLEIGRVGGPSGEPLPDEFGRLRWVIGDSAGRLYVADDLAREIRVFGPAGEFLRTLGGPGSGPGEFGGLHGMAWLARDTLLVVDYGNARLTRLTASGEHLGQWGWARLTGSTRFLFNGGVGDVYAYVPVPGRRDGERLGSVWVRYVPGEAPDTLEIPTHDVARTRWASNSVTCRGDGIGFFDNPYAPTFLRIPGPGLERVVAVSSEYRIAFLDPGGDTLRVISRETPRVPLPDSAWASLEERLAAFRAQWRGSPCQGDISRPEHLPVLKDLFFDHHGRLLVEHNRADGPAFDVFDPGGRWVGTFPAPDRDRSVPPYLYDDRLHSVTRDSLDVQRVQVHHLTGDGFE